MKKQRVSGCPEAVFEGGCADEDEGWVLIHSNEMSIRDLQNIANKHLKRGGQDEKF